RIRQPHVLPVFPAVSGLGYTNSGIRGPAGVRFARTDVDHLAVRVAQREGPDRESRLGIEERRPGAAPAVGPPETSGGEGDDQRIATVRGRGVVNNTPSVNLGPDVSEPQAGQRRFLLHLLAAGPSGQASLGVHAEAAGMKLFALLLLCQ